MNGVIGSACYGSLRSNAGSRTACADIRIAHRIEVYVSVISLCFHINITNEISSILNFHYAKCKAQMKI